MALDITYDVFLNGCNFYAEFWIKIVSNRFILCYVWFQQVFVEYLSRDQLVSTLLLIFSVTWSVFEHLTYTHVVCESKASSNQPVLANDKVIMTRTCSAQCFVSANALSFILSLSPISLVLSMSFESIVNSICHTVAYFYYIYTHYHLQLYAKFRRTDSFLEF